MMGCGAGDSGMPLEELQQAQGVLGPLYYVAFKVPRGGGGLLPGRTPRNMLPKLSRV